MNTVRLYNDKDKLYQLLLIIIIFLGFIVRIWGIDFGLPDQFRPDEEYVVAHANGLSFKDLNPHFFFYPALYFYFIAIFYKIISFVNILSEGFLDLSLNFYPKYFHMNLHLYARFLTVLFGVLTIYFTNILSKKLMGSFAGVVCAGLLAVNVLHVRESKFATTDITMTMFVVLALIAIIAVHRSGKFSSYCIAGLFCGLALSTKYSAIALGIPLFFANFFRVLDCLILNQFLLSKEIKRSILREIFYFICSVSLLFIIFFALNPYLIIDFTTVKKNLEYQAPFIKNGLPESGIPFGWEWILNYAFPMASGYYFLVLAILGITISIYKAIKSRFKESENLIIAIFIISMCCALTSSKHLYLRYVLPMLPFMCIMAYLGIKTVSEFLSDYTKKITNITLVAIIIVPSTFTVIDTCKLFATKDTRTLATEWINNNIPVGSQIVTDAYYWYPKPRLSQKYQYIDFSELLSGKSKTKWILIDSHPIKQFSAKVPNAIAQLIQRKAIQKVIFSPFTESENQTAEFDLYDAFYIPLKGTSTVERPGPVITIYKLN